MPAIQERTGRQDNISKQKRCQKTLGKCITIDGKGLFSGKNVTMTMYPAEKDTGVVFRRKDLAGNPCVRALINNVVATNRCTVIAEKGVMIQCVEHVLSALYAYKIDNVIVELDAQEPPICDGSARSFVKMIEDAGVIELEEMVYDYYLKEPVYLTENGMEIIGLPSETFKCSYTVSYEGHQLLDAQFYSFDEAESSYKKDISLARTFALYEEIKELVHKKVINNISLDHGVVIDGDKVLNKGGLCYANEMARHKILDFIGDISLVGKQVVGNFVCIRSGHRLNTKFADKLYGLLNGGEQ